MTNPANSFSTNFGRFYRHPSAGLVEHERAELTDPFGLYTPKPSVTNIISVMDKKFLPPYYARLVAEYAIENLDNLAATVAKFGSQVAIGTLKAVPNRPNSAASIGDEVHNAIDEWCQNRESVPEFATTTAAAMYQQWLCFAERFPFEVERSEFTCWSYQYGYAGTGDLLFRTEDGLWLVDTKTGKSVYPEVALQTTALAHADVILSASGEESPMPAADVQGVLHVRPRSVKLHRLDRTEEAFSAFLAAKELFDWRRFHAEKTLLEPFRSERPKAA